MLLFSPLTFVFFPLSLFYSHIRNKCNLPKSNFVLFCLPSSLTDTSESAGSVFVVSPVVATIDVCTSVSLLTERKEGSEELSRITAKRKRRGEKSVVSVVVVGSGKKRRRKPVYRRTKEPKELHRAKWQEHLASSLSPFLSSSSPSLSLLLTRSLFPSRRFIERSTDDSTVRTVLSSQPTTTAIRLSPVSFWSYS